MSIGSLSAISALANLNTAPATKVATGSDSSFSTFLQGAIDQANTLSSQADTLSASYAAGGPVSVDQVMIAGQRASLAVDLVVQVRNRAVSAYQSIMNMQV